MSHIRSDRETMVLRNTPLEASPNNNKMMLLEIAVLNKKIAEGISCCFCSKSITAEEELPANSDIKYSYLKYNIYYFCCPKCEAISHMSCFLTHSKCKKLPCNRCGMLLLSNDTNRLFAQLIYVYAAKDEWFIIFKKQYNAYLYGSIDISTKERNVSQSQIMEILIESKTLIYMDQEYLWDFLSEYFSKQKMNHRDHFKAYFTILHQQKTDVVKTYTSMSEKEKQELIETGNILISIDALQSQLAQPLAPSDFLQIYKNCFEQKAFSPAAEKHLGEHAVYFIMGMDNPLKYMEEMLIEMLKSKDLVIEEELTAEVMDRMAKSPLVPEFLKKRTDDPLALNFLRSILSEIDNNNTFLLIKITHKYVMSENRGVFVPLLINYFENHGLMKVMANKVMEVQLRVTVKEEVKEGITGFSRK
ncbi:hypothetical protein ENBRE01_3224 [Enteropsectra breve]|nr:hypothetical protein ENBRE01_3224 [Enteropsectra breve]